MKGWLWRMGILQGILLTTLSLGCEELNIDFLNEHGSHRHGGEDSDTILDNETDSGCYSPTQNWSTAYEEGAYGCDCDVESKGVCIAGTALICSAGQWTAVEDGPCMPGADDCVVVDSLDTCFDSHMYCEVYADGTVCARF